MASDIHTSIDDINKILADVLAAYPNLYVGPTSDPQKMLYVGVIAPIINRSALACDAFRKKKMVVGAKGGEGSFSVAGTISLNPGDSIFRGMKAMAISFPAKSDETWQVYWLRMFAKMGKTPSALWMRSDNSGSILPKSIASTVLISTDPIHESIVGGMVSHLYDMGLAPSLLKYMGMYVCDAASTSATTSSGKPSFVFERLDFSLLDLFGGAVNRPGTVAHPPDPVMFSTFQATTPWDFMIWWAQLTHSITVGKYHFGLIHADMHPHNIMFAHVKNGALRRGTPAGIVYDAKPLAEADMYSYEMPFPVDPVTGAWMKPDTPGSVPARLILENNGLLPKIIDYGLTAAHIGEAHPSLNKIAGLSFLNDAASTYDRVIQGWDAVTNQAGFGNVEFNFIVMNLEYQLRKMMDAAGTRTHSYDRMGAQKASDLWKGGLKDFCRAVLPPKSLAQKFEGLAPGDILYDSLASGKPVKYSETKSTGRRTTSNLTDEFRRGDGWTLMMRNVGTTDIVDTPLINLWNFFRSTSTEGGGSRGSFNPETGSYGLWVTRSNRPMVSSSANSAIVTVPYRRPSPPNQMDAFIRYNRILWEECIKQGVTGDRNRIVALARASGIRELNSCVDVRNSIDNTNPSYREAFPFFNGFVMPSSNVLWDKALGGIKNGITQAMLPVEHLRFGIPGVASMYSFRLDPSVLGPSAKISEEETLSFSKGSVMVSDLQRPDPSAVPSESFHLMYVDPTKMTFSFDVSTGSLEDARGRLLGPGKGFGFGISAGYLVRAVDAKAAIPGSMDVKFATLRPVGFYYTSTGNKVGNGTLFPIPRRYSRHFATVYAKPDGTMGMDRSPEFMGKHALITKNSLFVTSPPDAPQRVSTIVRVPIIAMTGLEPKITDPSFKYTHAFETGPILIWNGKIEMRRRLIVEADFRYDLLEDDGPTVSSPTYQGETITPGRPSSCTLYRVLLPAKTSSMYEIQPGEQEDDTYGQRRGNVVSTQMVLAETTDGKTLIVLVEGRGYGGMGIDHAQLTALVSRFSVKKAVALNGSFSASFLVANAIPGQEDVRWISQEPFQGVGGMRIYATKRS